MAERSAIEWTDATFNPWIGCTKISPACDHCYAAVSTPARTLGIAWGAGKPRRQTSPANWKLPIRWNRSDDYFQCHCGRRGEHSEFAAHPHCPLRPVRRRVFCASLADVFDNDVPASWRVDLFGLIRATPNLDWLLLTKRIGNAVTMMDDAGAWSGASLTGARNPLPNVWIGATVANQAEADRDIPKLLQVPAAVRFLSCEPLLGQIDLSRWLFPFKPCGNCPCPDPEIDRTCINDCCRDPELLQSDIDWVIAGGESGAGARPMHPDWVRTLRDQCAAAGVPFLFKQWGEHSLAYDRDRDDPDWRKCAEHNRLPGRWINLAGDHGFHGERVHYAHRVGKRTAGRLLDGAEHNGFPEVRHD